MISMDISSKRCHIFCVAGVLIICTTLFLNQPLDSLDIFTIIKLEDPVEILTAYDVKFYTLDNVTKDRVERVQRERKQRVQEVCNLYAKKKPQASYPFVPWNLYVDERNQFIYCAIGKVGSTSWLMKMAGSAPRNRSYGMTALDITDIKNAHREQWLAQYDIRPLHYYSQQEWKEKLNKYYKTLFVRHPLDRLLSAYLSKFEGREDNKGQRFKDTYEHYKSEIINKIRTDNKNGNTATQITFEEFLKFIVLDNQSANDQRGRGTDQVDIHWSLYNDACHFCDISYDFIGNFNTLEDDIGYVLRKLYSDDDDYWFPTINQSPVKTALDYYRNISEDLVEQVENTYQFDFDLFQFQKGLYSIKS